MTKNNTTKKVKKQVTITLSQETKGKIDGKGGERTPNKSKFLFRMIFLVIIVILGVGGYFGYRLRQIQNIKNSNKQFFSLLKNNQNFLAWNATAMVFKQKVDLNSFNSFINENNISNIDANNLTDSFLKGFKGKLSGKFGDSTIQIMFVDESGQRKIYEILVGSGTKLPADFKYVPPKSAGAGRTSVRPKDLDKIEEQERLPTTDEAKKLVNESMSGFVSALNKKDFTDFYKNSAELFKGQTDAKTIQNSFQKFIDEKIDLNYIKELQPKFSGNIQKDNYGFLVLNGKYSFSGKQDLIFTLKYNKENSLWKLISISVSLN